MVVKAWAGYRLTAQHDVLAHREHRDEHEVLVDHADAKPDGVAGAGDLCRCAVDEDLARVGVNEPVQDVHQRALAGPVLPHQSVDLALAHREVDVIVGDHPGPGLGDAAHLNGIRIAGGCTHSVPGEYGMPSAAGGMLRPTTPARTISVRMYGSMLIVLAGVVGRSIPPGRSA